MRAAFNGASVTTASRNIGTNLALNATSSSLRDRLYRLLQQGVVGRSVEVGPGLAVGSVKGPIRKDNQDRAVIARISHGSDATQEVTVAAIFDGMGGMIDGGAAATLAASTFLVELGTSKGALDRRLSSALSLANEEVFGRFRGRGGTTMTAIAFNNFGSGYAIHVGDSRLYQRTQKELVLLTVDDTVQGVVQGRFGRNEDELDNQLIQFVGIGSDLQPHLIKVSGSPDTTWIITTDGAHGLGKQIMHGVSASSGTAADFVRKLIYVADASGAPDNATVAALHMPAMQKNDAFNDGITFSIWTPSNKLEIWTDRLVSSLPAYGLPEPDTRELLPKTVQDRSTQEKKGKDRQGGRKKKGAAKKASKSTKANRATDDDLEAAPQLNITFGGRTSSRD